MLLLDENIAAHLVPFLGNLYPGCADVGSCGLAGASDLAIWRYARDHGLVIVSKDEDFQRLSVLYGAPPKVIWLGLGNCSTADTSNLLARRRGEIERFVADREAAFLVLA